MLLRQPVWRSACRHFGAATRYTMRTAENGSPVWVSRVSHGLYRLGCERELAAELGGEIGFVDIPAALGSVLLPGRPFCMVEGVGGLRMLESPLAGLISARNGELLEHPARAGEGAEHPEAAWIIEIDLELEEGEEEEEFEELPVWDGGSDSVSVEAMAADLYYDGDDDIRAGNAAFLLAQQQQQQQQQQQLLHTYVCSFGPGPLGLAYAVVGDAQGRRADVFKVEASSGQAKALGVQVDDHILAVGGRDLHGLSADDFVAIATGKERPLEIRFERDNTKGHDQAS